MAAVSAFLGILLISLLVALLATLQLGDFFMANSEFGLVIVGVMAFTAISLAVFWAASSRVTRPSHLAYVALGLALLALYPIVLPGLVAAIAAHSTNPWSVGIEETYITIELVIPALLAVLVQWGLVRRRWLRANGEPDATRWPWIATATSALVILNPIGLSFVASTLKHAAGDFMWPLTATVTGSGIALLVVMAAIECYIRDRHLRRGGGASHPSLGSAMRSLMPRRFMQGATNAGKH
jgi:hypothetical protein